MKIFQPKITQTLKGYTGKQLAADLVAGLIVAIIALPLSIALAIASGVSPEKGIYTAIVAGFVIAALGGSRVNISGPTAAFATIVAGIVAQYDVDGLIVATIMAGLILVIMGVLRLGSLIKYIPVTITTGFTAGIAVTILVGQVKDFLGLTYPSGTANIETTAKVANIVRHFGTINLQALLVGCVGLAVLIIWPKINKKIPGSLIAVVVGILFVKLTGMKVNTIGDLYTIGSSLPVPHLPQVTLATVEELVPSAFTIAVLAAIESLLSCVVSDGMIGDKHNSNTELVAQGFGNICSGVFGGIPATGAIARTAANVKNGGRTPVSGMVHAGVLLLVLVVLMPYAAWIPMPIIAAILFMVAYNMSEWRRFVRICKTAPATEVLVLVATFVLTVVFDLVVAIGAGIVLTALLFLKQMTAVSGVRRWTEEPESADGKIVPARVAVFEMEGALFFAAADELLQFPLQPTDKVLLLRMSKVSSVDITAAEMLRKLVEQCKEKGVRVIFSHLNEQPMQMLSRCGFGELLEKEAFCPNINAAIAYAAVLTQRN